MAFFEKLGELAKNVGEMTNEALENSRKGSQITSETKKIRELKEQIGNYYWEEYQNGTRLYEPVQELCEEIKSSMEIIAALQEELEAARKAQEETEIAAAPAAGNICPSCGNENGADVRFCAQCGQKLEETPAERFCTSCGTKNAAGTNFCCKCGAKLEE